jgi:hypothetical protein
MKWSFFVNRKPKAGKIIIEFIKTGRNKDPHFGKFLRLDNSGENQAMVANLKKEEVEISIKFTAPHTPEQNGKVERSFATLWGKTRAMLNRAGFPDELREKLWAECASTATKLNNLMIKKEGKNPYELFYIEKLDLGSKLRIFGEIGIKEGKNSYELFYKEKLDLGSKLRIFWEIGIKKDYNVNLSNKLKNKGGPCAFLGYPENHPRETFKVFNLKSEKPIVTREM